MQGSWQKSQKLFRNLAQSYALGKRNSQQCRQDNVNKVNTNMHMERIVFIQCGIPRQEVEHDNEDNSSSDTDENTKGRDKMESDGYTSNGEDGNDESDESDLKEDSSPEEETEIKREANSTEEEASSIDSEKSKEKNDMSELTNSEKSDNENEMRELTNSEASSDEEEMP